MYTECIILYISRDKRGKLAKVDGCWLLPGARLSLFREMLLFITASSTPDWYSCRAIQPEGEVKRRNT